MSLLVHLPLTALVDVHGCPADPGACQPFGKCAFKNKRGRTEALWHADNGFTASCRSEVREQTSPIITRGGGEEG
ncbi:hypothetical protein PBY51_011447 [Eleginops maclovinus]|uniref:Uncharacterized protein n=1 Tax=Eleginops maclovinus TaxID=56733 RepID=A0AAN7XNQ7_ELEMC|nr:hypothetical protein PBY51_011447 [Eleginops maclovinus]